MPMGLAWAIPRACSGEFSRSCGDYQSHQVVDGGSAALPKTPGSGRPPRFALSMQSFAQSTPSSDLV